MGSGIEGSEIDTRQKNSLQTQYPIQSLPGVVSLGKTQLKREADHSQTTIEKVENGGAVSPLPYTPSWISN
jgi:hypothetical protein